MYSIHTTLTFLGKKKNEGRGVPVGATELVKPAAAGEDDERQVDVAEDRELTSLLDQSATPL